MDFAVTQNYDEKKRHVSVDSFRGLAALSVVMAHMQCGIEYAAIPSTVVVHDSIGGLLLYLFRGTSVYFMVITGFILAARMPEWKRHRHGLLYRSAQRITKVVIVYWVAMTMIMTINLIRYSLFGTAWVKPTFWEAISQYLFFSNFMNTNQLYIPPGWYLEADFILFVGVTACYITWSKLPDALQNRLRPLIFIATIPLVFLAIYVEAMNPFARYIYAPIRLVSYFLIGFLAWHSKRYASAMFALIFNSMLILLWNDQTNLHKHFFTSNSVVLAFIFFASHYSLPLQTLTNQPVIRKLYKINFGLFLLNWFALGIGFSFARHFVPHSIVGLFVILALTMTILIVLSYFFERLIQRPLLEWHDAVWNKLLAPHQGHEVKPDEPGMSRAAAVAPRLVRVETELVQPSGK